MEKFLEKLKDRQRQRGFDSAVKKRLNMSAANIGQCACDWMQRSGLDKIKIGNIKSGTDVNLPVVEKSVGEVCKDEKYDMTDKASAEQRQENLRALWKKYLIFPLIESLEVKEEEKESKIKGLLEYFGKFMHQGGHINMINTVLAYQGNDRGFIIQGNDTKRNFKISVVGKEIIMTEILEVNALAVGGPSERAGEDLIRSDKDKGPLMVLTAKTALFFGKDGVPKNELRSVDLDAKDDAVLSYVDERGLIEKIKDFLNSINEIFREHLQEKKLKKIMSSNLTQRDINLCVKDWTRGGQIFFGKTGERSLDDVCKEKSIEGGYRVIEEESLKKLWQEELISKVSILQTDEQKQVALKYLSDYMHQVGCLNILEYSLSEIAVAKGVCFDAAKTDRTFVIFIEDNKIHMRETVKPRKIMNENGDALANDSDKLMVATGEYVISFEGKNKKPKFSIESVKLEHHSDYTRKMFSEISVPKPERKKPIKKAEGKATGDAPKLF